MMTTYKTTAFRELANQQTRFSPRNVRLEQVERAEALLAEIDLTTDHSYTDLCAQITGYRSDRFAELVLSGKDAAHDLRCFVEDLSDSLDLTPECIGEPLLSVEDVSEQFKVSTKTVQRWRNKGLASRRILSEGRKRIMFLESAVRQFVSRNDDSVERGSRFRQMTDDDRVKLLNTARKLAHSGQGLMEVSRKVGRMLDRAPETVRYTVRQYDAANPQSAIFPMVQSGMTPEKRNEMYRSFQRGASASDIAKRYKLSRTRVHGIIAEMRALRLKNTVIEFMDSDDFHEKSADKRILTDAPENADAGAPTKPPSGLPAYLASLYDVPLLNREQEGHHFRKMNYLRFKASALQEKIDHKNPSKPILDSIERFLEEAAAVKNLLIRSNLRLVVSIAKRHIKPGMNFFELVSDGNMSLIRAIEKFDYTRGNKFSTYATWAIMKNFARSIPAEHTRLDRFRTGLDELFSFSNDERSTALHDERVNKAQQEAIGQILNGLDPRERDIIMHRFGLDEDTEPETLEQVGRRLGVTKERIRQIEARSLNKLRRFAIENQVDIPEF